MDAITENSAANNHSYAVHRTPFCLYGITKTHGHVKGKFRRINKGF